MPPRAFIPALGLLATAVVTGCFGNNNVSNPGPWVLNSSPSNIEIRYDSGDSRQAERRATEHCALHQRTPVLRSRAEVKDEPVAIYDCQ